MSPHFLLPRLSPIAASSFSSSSSRDHATPIATCTATASSSYLHGLVGATRSLLLLASLSGGGVEAALLLSRMPSDLVGEKMNSQKFYDAVNFLLSMQSNNGGFPAWEPRRAYRWLEKFNPTEIFEACLIESEHIDCTGSAMQALALFRKLYPNHRRREVDNSISKAIRFMESKQNLDGSWYSCWEICFTEGAWIAVKGLTACGKNYQNCPALSKTCEFLLSKQLPNGGWGESYLSCKNMVYTNLEDNRSNIVQTSWALLALIGAGQ
ncbi:Lupeol synthase, partial [Stylosanthes scabra]|nr:Lupeol synthase [Stylosanthes scabra]